MSQQPDPRHPFDAHRCLETFQAGPERVIHAADDPSLGEMADRAREAWAAFVDDDKDNE